MACSGLAVGLKMRVLAKDRRKLFRAQGGNGELKCSQ